MKLLRYLRQDGPRIGMIVGDGIIDITSHMPEFTEIRQIAAEGKPALDRIAAACSGATPDLALADATLLAPIERPGKYLAIGMNYAKHSDEADKLGIARSKYQTWFNKQTSCITGPYDDIDPGVSGQLDYEVELGVARQSG